MPKLHFRPYICNQTVLFPQRIDENIAENDPVRIVNAVVDGLNIDNFRKLYKESGRSPYHPKMMLKVILYAYMNNVYSCRRIEKLLLRDIHFIWLAGYEKPDFITLIGANGAGKSTLLMTLCGDPRATRGSISLHTFIKRWTGSRRKYS